MIKAISFDLDGTLADEKFDSLIWNEELPKAYAKKKNLTFERAKEKIFATFYTAEWFEKLSWDKWTDLEYWCNRFQVGDWKEIVQRLRNEVLVFEDVFPVLEQLKKNYKLIIVSNANEKFLNVKLEIEGLKKYFDHIYSAPSQFKLRKSKPVFKLILKELHLKPQEVVHVGDDHDGDYLVPRELGMRAFHLLRGRKRKGEFEINSLKELLKKLDG
ncbi:MAG TPA: HAD family hydrolase [Candidatus Nanoarchaeia archaeon]|nr:HAD family hydrolase [Candidatus Nanoarchaeia archaeon]